MTALATVLVVDDEPDVADAYASHVRTEYAVRVAYTGREALASLDEDVDAVLLDRRMPGLAGDEVLERIRERGLDCRVAMVTGVEPDVDVVNMGFDDYLLKPVEPDELLDTIEYLLALSALDAQLRKYFSLVSRQVALESQADPEELAEVPEFRELTDCRSDLEDRLEETLAELSDEEAFQAALSSVDLT